MATYRELAERHVGDMMNRAVELAGGLKWSRAQLDAHRRDALREFVRHAKSRSSWHASRLADVDTERLTQNDLVRLPTMTKDDLMANWDRIVTDPRLTLTKVEHHLDTLTDADAYLLDEFHACASGGSSGRRGVFVFGWHEWATIWASYTRYLFGMPGVSPDQPPVLAVVGARSATHMSVALGSTFSAGAVRFPVDLPLADIVHGLNELKPSMVVGYPSALGVLVDEHRAGRLRIAPRFVTGTSEPLLPEIAAGIREAWGVTPLNVYASTDFGLMAIGCGHSDAMHLNEDLLVCETVDTDNRPVPLGDPCSKMLVTSLFGTTLPLIRYELTDEVTLLPSPCPCGSPFVRMAHIQGRMDDVFRYSDGTAVHPHVLRSPLSHRAAIVEYQVRQTARGVDVMVRASGPFDAAGLQAELTRALEGAGLKAAQVNVRTVEAIERTGIGKLKRFVPAP
jgi:phenylacetate-coenzyme A ligase PaaK-like adenylate-forming protein